MRRKLTAWQNWEPFIICPSAKTFEAFEKRQLAHKWQGAIIPNAFDFKAFSPINRKRARARLGIEDSRKIVLFGAQYGIEDQRKGFDLLVDAIFHMSERERANHLMLTFGGPGEIGPIGGMQCRSLGFIDDPDMLATAYSAADVFVNPSRQETFGNTTLEAIACGTPVVSFDTGAAAQMVASTEAGTVVPLGDPAGMARAIVHHAAKGEGSHREKMRRDAIALFAPERIVAEHTAVYARLIGNKI